jgi:hypothetical protein
VCGQYFRKEIAEPFGIDFMIGFWPEEDPHGRDDSRANAGADE